MKRSIRISSNTLIVRILLIAKIGKKLYRLMLRGKMSSMFKEITNSCLSSKPPNSLKMSSLILLT